MAFSQVLALVALFLVLQLTNASNTLSPSMAPNLDNICDGVQCGKGTCQGSFNYTYNFICECDPGWKQTSSDKDGNDNHRFLPCVIPNCTYSCGEAPPPTPEIQEPPNNISFFDPCYWAYCGGGTCSEKMGHGYSCNCKEGYSNLMNITAYPCLKQCAIGSDCQDKGITFSNSTTASTPTESTNGIERSNISRNFLLSMILIISVASVL